MLAHRSITWPKTPELTDFEADFMG